MDNRVVTTRASFDIDIDVEAGAWLAAHPTERPRLVAYDVSWCCGGGKMCRVSVREMTRNDDPDKYVRAVSRDGAALLIDRRAAARLPSRFGLTVRGLGRWKHLDLALEADQWGDLLYT
jgi:hypothetical protein